MDYYAGIKKGVDRITGGGRYVARHKYGFEIYNFLRSASRVYGYVQVKGANNITRLGASPDADRVDGVTIVWAARRRTGGIYVVGWYRNATVFREYQSSPNDRRRREPGTGRLMSWNITARARDIRLLRDEERRFKLRYGRDALGMSLTNYVDGATASERRLQRRLLQYVGSDGAAGETAASTRRRRGPGRQQDPALRSRIELAAMQLVGDWYEKHGFQIKPIYRDCVGWDLEARSNGRVLRLEVKGCSSDSPACELTPNEFSKMHRHRDNYRVCIVTNALGRRPKLWDFRYVAEKGGWLDSDAHYLELTKRTGALVSVR